MLATFAGVRAAVVAGALGGHPLRAPGGGDSGARIVDVNGDGLSDGLVAGDAGGVTRVWDARGGVWVSLPPPPWPLAVGGRPTNVRHGTLDGVFFVVTVEPASADGPARVAAAALCGSDWVAAPTGVAAGADGVEPAVVFTADFDADGRPELVVLAKDRSSHVYRPRPARAAAGPCASGVGWVYAGRLPWDAGGGLADAVLSGAAGAKTATPGVRGGAVDTGLRLADVDGDGDHDVIVGSPHACGLCVAAARDARMHFPHERPIRHMHFPHGSPIRHMHFPHGRPTRPTQTVTRHVAGRTGSCLRDGPASAARRRGAACSSALDRASRCPRSRYPMARSRARSWMACAAASSSRTNARTWRARGAHASIRIWLSRTGALCANRYL